MTPSTSSQDPSPRVDQEGIWDTPEPSGPMPPTARSGHPSATEPARPGVAPSRSARGAGATGSWTRSLTTTAAQPGPAGLAFAAASDRIIALILDLIVLAIVGLILALVIGGFFGGLSGGSSAAGGSLDAADGDLNVAAFLVVGIAQLALSFAYFGYSWVVLRGTAGMKALGLQVGDQGDGHAINWDQALIRWLLMGIPATLATFAVSVPSALGLLLGILGSTWLAVLLYTIARSPTRQGWHDRRARTIVTRVSRRAI